MELIIAEKPDAAKRIAEALSNKPVKKNYHNVPYYELEHNGRKIVVGCAVGHLFNLKEKEKGWGYPVFNLEWQPSYIVSRSAKFTKRYLDALGMLTKKADSFVVACDYDTEGSLIGWNCIRFVCKRKDARRMRFSTLTKQELIDAYKNAVQHLDFRQIESGETRHWLDHYYGVSSSRALMHAIKKSGRFKILSSGRVQSPVLALLTHREDEIDRFNPVPYWLVLASFNGIVAKHRKDRFFRKEDADAVYQNCIKKSARITKVERRESKLEPPAPFNITTLQTEAYNSMGFSPQQTLNIAERLYLSAYISYPRTSSERLDPRIGYKEILKSLSSIKEFSSAQTVLKGSLKPKEGKRADPAHIAIYPTKDRPDLSRLPDDQRKLYMMIATRFIACFGEDAVREHVKAEADIGGELFAADGTRTVKHGWLDLYPYAELKENRLPDIREGEEYKVEELEIKADETKPPKRYTQGSIISEMERHGLGTRATRSGILQTLYDRRYIEDRSIKVTKLGRAVAETLERFVPELVSEKLTRHFEKEIEQIQEGRKKKGLVLDEAKRTLTKIFEHFRQNELRIGEALLKAHKETEESILGSCPNCNGELRILYSKKTKKRFVACNKYPDCKTTFSLPLGLVIATGKVCKDCNLPVIKVVRKGKKPFEMCLTYDCKSKEHWSKQ